MAQTSPFVLLPVELIEAIAVYSALPDTPYSLAALAQTCTLLRGLLYQTTDTHLWREVFLATFDSPSSLEAVLGISEHHYDYDWAGEFKARTGVHPTAAAVLAATFEAPPIPPFEHAHKFGVIPLPDRHRTSETRNSRWIADVLRRSAFSPEFESSSKLQWLYGPPPFVDTDEKIRRACKVAVYDLRYLSPKRCWGPFLPTSGAVDKDETQAQMPIYSLRINLDIPDESDDPDDPDYIEHAEDASDIARAASSIRAVYLQLDGNPLEPQQTSIHPEFPHTLIPDYDWLAAARLLIEENIRERAFIVFPDSADEHAFLAEVKALRKLEVLRMGGQPEYWDHVGDRWKGLLESRPDKGKMKQGEVDGWDWAGVEGEYRRIVCWMDYRELILHNFYGTSVAPPPALRYNSETTRVFPMRLKVAGYAPPPDPPADYEQLSVQDKLPYLLPIIEVEGAARGSDVDATASREISGTVRMIGDGTVRWQLTSAEEGSGDPEWVVDCVQMGAPGSAMGIMGLWTGAAHEKTDPIGPSWAWKIN
ncbi:hypothetical protein CYLTODRAFT_424008 [Cylindrobasidium torrendii FP15055 ss-10]|uniref:F-box domain-containing protein n=1 Tax=Cylindrobasidium torrendii FP15055 ss-10 TaxID=1314674 RepID=A0A0D7B5Q1_9AGAR|nr:hypothetical protein CYLTODRAFT_424008 [Cylindrobasidium torrendii FP15055 ss-10]